jgi:acid stress-induced BolA-like protein IbaG/YrbA
LPPGWLAIRSRSKGTGDTGHATIVSTEFEGKRLIQRHQRVYATLGQKMHTDEVHALSMKTHTPAEWLALSKSTPSMAGHQGA